VTSPASVSVLIPCRNAERYIEETLASALAQTRPATEIIVVDDGSTDRSRELIARLGPAVTVVANVGRGASAARNHATSLARGEFLQYLDADDLLEPHALESRTDGLVSAGADVAVSDWQRLIERGHEWVAGRVESGAPAGGDEPTDLKVFRGFWAPPAAILYRRSLCAQIGGWHEGMPVIQDARCLFDAAARSPRFVHVRGVGARYRQHTGNSLSSRSSVAFWSDVLRNSREVEQVWRQGGQMDAAHLDAVAGAYAHCALVGFSADRALFDASCLELDRFPEHRPRKALRLAMMLHRVIGYGAARAVSSRFIRV
jgi:glycosyltransferase involved in cell wall biosynthesis